MRGGSMNSDGEFFQRDRSQQPPALTHFYKTSVLRSPRIPLWSLQNSLSGVTGPIFRPEELGPLDNDLIRNYAHDGDPVGERIIVHGRVLDENGRGVPNTLLEFWQANAGGRCRHKNDTYFAPSTPTRGRSADPPRPDHRHHPRPGRDPALDRAAGHERGPAARQPGLPLRHRAAGRCQILFENKLQES